MWACVGDGRGGWMVEGLVWVWAGLGVGRGSGLVAWTRGGVYCRLLTGSVCV